MTMRFVIVVVSALVVPCTVAVSLADDQKAESKAECKCTDCKCAEGDSSGCKCTDCKCGESQCTEGKCAEGKCAEGKCAEGSGKQCCSEGKCSEGKCTKGTCCKQSKCCKGSCGGEGLACSGKQCCSEGTSCNDGKCSEGKCSEEGNCAVGYASCSEDSALRFRGYGLFDAESTSPVSNEVWKRLARELDADARACKATEATANETTGSVFLVLDNVAGGDVALRQKCGADTTVGSVLRGSVLPRPMNFVDAKIEVRRARTIMNEDQSLEVEERILPVLWDQATGEPTKCTNHALQPNDRVLVRVHATSDDRPRAVAAAYSQASPMIQRAIPVPRAAMASKTPTQIQYNIQVVEDCEGCMSEYEALERGAPMMFAESKTLLPAMRALQKHELIRQLSSPKLICTAGETAQMEIGSESAEKWEGLRLEVASEQVENGLKVELAMHSTQDERNVKVCTSLIVEPGQTIVLNANATPMAKDTSNSEEPAVYVIVTPEVVE